MLLIFCTIFTIANGVLDIPVKFNRPKWMNNSEGLETFFNTNESKENEINPQRCMAFNQSETSFDNFQLEATCHESQICRMANYVPPKYCPLHGSVTRIVFYLENTTFDGAFFIVAEGCYFYNNKNQTVKGDWYISNKRTIDLKNLINLEKDFLNISDLSTMKCSMFCRSFDCERNYKIKLNLRFFNEEIELKNFNKFIIAATSGGILILVVLSFIVFFIKNLKNNINNFNT